MFRKPVVIFLWLGLLFPVDAFAKIGVGIGTGKVEVNERLRPGGTYTLPPLTVVNTGDETSDYGLSIEYHQYQTQLFPVRDWFVFSPDRFSLDPGQSQVVEIKLNLPIKTEPGDYFAYLEAHPEKKSENAGGAVVGIASAAKLYFKVSPANIWQGIYYRSISFWKNYSPWTSVVAIVTLILVAIIIFRKFFSFQIGISKKNKSKEAE